MHELKTWPEFFQKLWDGDKTFEVRVNDRDFQVDDMLMLQEYDPITKTYSGRTVTHRVSYIAQGVFGLPENVCVMALK